MRDILIGAYQRFDADDRQSQMERVRRCLERYAQDKNFGDLQPEDCDAVRDLVERFQRVNSKYGAVVEIHPHLQLLATAISGLETHEQAVA